MSINGEGEYVWLVRMSIVGEVSMVGEGDYNMVGKSECGW